MTSASAFVAESVDRSPAPAGPLLPLLCAALCFLVLFPTLGWMQFQNSIENLTVATALETRREGRWLVPTLQGEIRTRKPPLSVWLAALAVPPTIVRDMSSADPAVRERAYDLFTRQVRWPFLLSSCLMLIAVYDLGTTIGGWRGGLFSALAAATNLLFFKYSRIASSDTELALWVAVTNAMLARAILRRQHWFGFIGAGMALGLGILTKGPIALLQTVLPVAIFSVWWRKRAGEQSALPRPRVAVAVLTAACLALLISLPWYVLMLRRVPGVGHVWFNEVTRLDPADPRPDPWYEIPKLFWTFLPWVFLMIAGLVAAGLSMRRRLRDPLVLALLLLLMPAMVMSFVPERKERYLLPLIPAAAVLAGCAVERYTRKPSREPGWLLALAAHWTALTVLAVGLPLWGAARLKTVEGQPWFSWPAAAGIAGASAIVILLGIVLQRRRPWTIAASTVLAMLIFDAAHYHARADTDGGRSDMKPLAEQIWARFPDAELYGQRPQGKVVPLDLSIYLNRQVRPLEELAAASERPQVLLLYQAKGADAPSPIPDEGWLPLSTAQRGNNTWHAFARRGLRSVD